MKISFTTLSCPNWSWEKILDEASKLGFDGIEIRGLQGEMFLPKCEPFFQENIAKTLQNVKEKGLEICCLDTSCTFHDQEKYDAAMEEGRATIDLAQQLGTPYIRVFGDKIPDQAQKAETIAMVAKGLQTLGKYAEGKGVYVLIETHGDFSDTTDLLAALKQTTSEAIGVLWDIVNPYKYGEGESMKDSYDKLSSYIKHAHIKDTLGRGDQKITLVGEGDVPIKEAVDVLKDSGYNGWLSFEWEKKWHPDIEEPEIALPAFMQYMKQM
jgi:sugar phosphate isomerase/epimerase